MSSPAPHQAAKQQGIVLVVVLVMLVVIGLASAFTMKQGINSDAVSQNVRAEALAQEAAQIALQFCEQQAAADKTKIKVAHNQGHWNDLANWQKASGDSVPTTLDDKSFASANASFAPKVMPQCMAEYSPLNAKVVLVTARGFSPDYEQDATSRQTLRGSVVWLQSTIRLN